MFIIGITSFTINFFSDFRHPYPPFNIHYRYRFHAPHHDTYEVSWVSFTTEKLENFNWNYLDHYICTRGDTDFQLAEVNIFFFFFFFPMLTKCCVIDRIFLCILRYPQLKDTVFFFHNL